MHYEHKYILQINLYDCIYATLTTMIWISNWVKYGVYWGDIRSEMFLEYAAELHQFKSSEDVEFLWFDTVDPDRTYSIEKSMAEAFITGKLVKYTHG